MKKFDISDKCNACGLCLAMTDLIVEDKNGFAHAKDGVFLKESFLGKANEIIGICPVGAISIKKCGHTSKSGKEGLIELKKVLENQLKSVAKPTAKKDSVSFDANNYNIEVGSCNSSSGYSYNSESAAEQAGLREFDKAAYSQYRSILLNVFIQYKNDKLRPYYTFDENSFYAQNNKKYEKILSEIMGEAKELVKNLPLNSNFAKFEVFPGDYSDGVLTREDCVYGLLHFEDQSTQSGVMAEFRSGSYSSLDSYAMYIDTDSIERSEKGFFGWTEKSVYRFYNVYKAISEYSSDLRRAMNYVDIDETAVYFLGTAIDAYNKSIDAALAAKVEEFSKAINAL